MDNSSLSKLKELVSCRRLKAAQKLLSEYLQQHPDDYALLMHMGGIQSSMFEFDKAEKYYKRAILSGKHQSGSAKVQLMRIYSQQSRYKDLIHLLLECLESESKSITLKEQIIQIYLLLFEHKSALIYSRKLIEQIKESQKNKQKTTERDEQRDKVLSDPMKQSDLFLIHSQILSKVGRFSDSIIYCKKAIFVLDTWLNSKSAQQMNVILTSYNKESMQYNRRMNQFYGFLGLCYLQIDDIENALSSFKKAKNVNPRDQIAQTNIFNLVNNKKLFDRCIVLKHLYQRYVANKLNENDKFSEDAMLEYLQLLIQQNRLFSAEQICDNLLHKRSDFKKSADLCIIFEDILRQKMNKMIENLSDSLKEKMEQKRNENGPKGVKMDMNDSDFMSLSDKIWNIRLKIDQMYAEQINLFRDNVQLHVAYCLSLWRIGYNSKGIELRTNEWSKYNEKLLNESKFLLSRSNAFMNDEQHKKALNELKKALVLCEENERDFIQCRLLMAVCLNKMNKLKRARNECECILKINGQNENEQALKMYAAILQKMKKYKESKKLYQNLLTKQQSKNGQIMEEYVHLLIEMKQFDEAKEKLQILLSKRSQNMQSLVYEFGVVCYKLKDYENAQKTLKSIIMGQNSMNLINRAYATLIRLYQDQNENDECENYLNSWIECNSYDKSAYFAYFEYLHQNKQMKKLKKLFNEWTDEMNVEYNDENKENDTNLVKKKEKIGYLLSELYQKYGRILTKDQINKNENDQNIEKLFEKSLKFNKDSVDALQGFAAYYISNKEYMKALPLLTKAKSLNPWNSLLWIQISKLLQNENKNNEALNVIKEGIAFIEAFEYETYKNCAYHMIKISEELIEQCILFGGNKAENIKMAETHCWLILNEFDSLNITALRNVSKVCNDRKKICHFFENLIGENPNYCPAMVEYAQFLSTAKNERKQKLEKADALLEKCIKMENVNEVNSAYRCIAFYLRAFVKMHQMEKGKGLSDENNVRLNDEARNLFFESVKADKNNIYARINLAQFLAFRDNELDKALIHLEYAYNNLNSDDPNLVANLIKVLAKKAIDKEHEKSPNIKLLQRAFALCGKAIKRYHGHFGLIVARSSLQNIKKKYNLMQLDDGLSEEEIEKIKQPQTTYGMVGVDIMNTQHLSNDNDNDNDTKENE